MNPESQDERILSSKIVLHLKKDEIVSIQTPGGGGYGDPNERDPELVLKDFQDGLISRERALTAYGIAFDKKGVSIDNKETVQPCRSESKKVRA